MKKLILSSAIGLLASVSAQADFQTSFELSYLDADADNGFGIAGTYYFDAVDDSNGPLAEAAFVDKASGVSAAFVGIDDNDTVALSGRFVLANDFTINATYMDSDIRDSTFGIGLGKYLTDTSEVALSIETNDFVDSLALDYHNLTKLDGDASFSYDLGLAYIDTDSDSGYGINGGVTYYPSSELGFGAFADLQNDFAGAQDTYGIEGQYFLDRGMAFGAEFARVDSNSGEEDTFTLTFEARF